jgi:hypothetical protein
LRRGAATVALAVAVGSIALSGCETKTGVAGFVGQSPIETNQLAGYVNRGDQAATGAQANISRPEIQQFWLQTLIELRLAQRVAAARGVTLGPTDTNVFMARYLPLQGGLPALQRQAEGFGIAPSDLSTLFQALALEDRIADQVAPGLLAPDSAARQAYQQLQASYPGQTYQQVGPDLRKLLVFDQRRAAVFPALQAEARTAGVRVNPRFGSWNLDRLTIGASPTDLARPATPSPAPAPPGQGSGDPGAGDQGAGGQGTGDSVPAPAP